MTTQATATDNTKILSMENLTLADLQGLPGMQKSGKAPLISGFCMAVMAMQNVSLGEALSLYFKQDPEAKDEIETALDKANSGAYDAIFQEAIKGNVSFLQQCRAALTQAGKRAATISVTMDAHGMVSVLSARAYTPREVK